MTPAVSVLAERYRPRKPTAARGRAFGNAAKVCGQMLAIIVFLTVVYTLALALASRPADARGRTPRPADAHAQGKKSTLAAPRDPRCDGSARYDAMRDGDFSGQGTGHACQ